MKTFLDYGFTELIDWMGDDYRILQSARVSTGGNAKKGDKADRGLIRYLYKNKHMSPFEQVVMTFHAKVPNFVMKQFLRHRTFSFNEYSQRYSPIIDDFYIPDHWRKQGEKNHQGSGEAFSEEDNMILTKEYTKAMDDSFDEYNSLIETGVAKEMARIVIPSSVYTEFYFTVDLRNLLHMLSLRLHEHAQYEIRVFAESIYDILREDGRIKWTMEIFDEMLELDWKIQKMLSNKIEPEEIINKL
jgi:thymidylate synthase (FAD)